MALVTGLTKLIEKELKGEHNPVACAEEEIYNGPLISNSTTEIIIPRIGDLIQELDIKYSYHVSGTVAKAYIETVPWGADLSYTPTLLRESINRTSLSETERRECTSNWDSAVCDDEQSGKYWKKQWPLHIFKIDTGLKLICDYEINLLRPYQVTKLVLVTENYNSLVNKHPVSIIANYIFVDIESRRKLFF
jgi:hypothetical protein